MKKQIGLEKLVQYLKDISPGRIEVSGTLVELLRYAWDEFEGSNEEKMEAYKLDRIETIRWKPPILYFTIERHGQTCAGSVFATIQKWEINLKLRTAVPSDIGSRQVSPKAPRLNVMPIAEEIGSLVVREEKDERLIWAKDGSVRIRIKELIPETKEQTTASRRKRFRKALTEFLASKGWREITANKFARK